MLPVARLIGHKDWTPRKSDPRHDMNWRRQRVAAFTPGGDDMALTDRIPDFDAQKRDNNPNATITVGEALATILQRVERAASGAPVWEYPLLDRDKDAREGTEGATTPAGVFLVEGASAATRTLAAQAATIEKLIVAGAASGKFDAQEMRQVIDEAFKENIVRVDIDVAGGKSGA